MSTTSDLSSAPSTAGITHAALSQEDSLISSARALALEEDLAKSTMSHEDLAHSDMTNSELGLGRQEDMSTPDLAGHDDITGQGQERALSGRQTDSKRQVAFQEDLTGFSDEMFRPATEGESRWLV